ncbi:hypothetical protein DBR06_SOUSAS6110087, partial [Sousa chinensis]
MQLESSIPGIKDSMIRDTRMKKHRICSEDRVYDFLNWNNTVCLNIRTCRKLLSKKRPTFRLRNEHRGDSKVRIQV